MNSTESLEAPEVFSLEEKMRITTMFYLLMERAHQNSQAKGFWENPSLAEKVALIHSEVSELLEEIRRIEPLPSSKITAYTGIEEELADIVIRVADLAQFMNVRLGEAIAAKMQYNSKRPAKHGKRF